MTLIRKIIYRYRARRLYKLAGKVAVITTTDATKPLIDQAITSLCAASREYEDSA